MPGGKVTSVIISAFNEIAYVRLCIESIFKHTRPPFELILIDNGTFGGTGEYFSSVRGARVIRNEAHQRLSVAYSQGTELSSGDYVLFLRSDTVVTVNWLDNLILCIESDPKIGLVEPVSNYAPVVRYPRLPYDNTLDSMHLMAKRFNRSDSSKYVEVDFLTGFCLLMKRSVIEKVGPFDERVGGLDDFGADEYFMRVKRAGFKLMRAGDTFIHRFDYRMPANDFAGRYAVTGSDEGQMQDKQATYTAADRKPIETYIESYLQKPDEFLEERFPESVRDFPALSLVMIVKDEEDSIGRCLESVKDVADEIIVVDTGSSDRTVEIAQSYGAKVFFHAWSGDFSEARNASLNHATGEWVMFLDADEELVAEDTPKLKALLKDAEREGFFFNEFSFVGDEKEGCAVAGFVFRLWRNRPEYRFSGTVHEQILPSIKARNPNISFSNIRINHYGYLGEEVEFKGKSRRNLDILLKQAESDPGNPFVMFDLGSEYLRLGNYEEALESYRKSLDGLSGLNASYASKLVINISICLRELGRYDEALETLTDAKEKYPEYTDLWFMEGLICLAKEDLKSALQCFKACLEKGISDGACVSQVGTGGHVAVYMLARVHRMLGNEQEAILHYKRALEDNTRYHVALLELGLLLGRHGDPEELKHSLEPLSDMSSTDILLSLALIFSQGGYYSISLGYLDRLADTGTISSQISFLRGECLFNLRRYDEAVAEFGIIPKSSRHYRAASADTAVCHLINGDFSRAIDTIDALENDTDFYLIHYIYRSLATMLNGEPITISLTDEQRDESYRFIADLMRKLIELEEFELFENTIELLELLGLSAGETSLVLGKIYYDTGFNELAIEELVKAYEGGCADGEAFLILGGLALDNKIYEDAKIFFLEALDRGTEELTLYVSLASTLAKLGETNHAIKILDIGLEKYPDSAIIASIRQGLSIS